MHGRWIIIGTLSLVVSLSSCKENTKAEAQVGNQAELGAKAEVQGAASAKTTLAAAVKPRIGGTIVLVGEHAVELLAFANGRVEALVMDARGELLADPGNAKLSAKLAAAGNARAHVNLGWDAPRLRFVGAAAADAKLVPGSVEVELTLAGKSALGSLAQLSLAAEASHGGQMLVAGDYSIELLANAGVVQAFVFDASGRAHAAGDLDLALDIGGAKQLNLVWDAPSLSYRATLAADVSLNAKPIVLTVKAGAKVATAACLSFQAGAQLDAAARAKLDAAARAKLDANLAAGAKLNVKVPNVAAELNAAKAAAAKATGSIKVAAPTVKVGTSASTGADAKAGAKAGFSIGTK